MISSAVAKARGSVFSTLPSESNTTVAGITLGTRSAAATRRLPSCSVGSRTPSSASRSKPAVSSSSWCTVTTITSDPTRRWYSAIAGSSVAHGAHQYAHKLSTMQWAANAGPTSTTESSAAHSDVTSRNAAGPGNPSGCGHGANSALWCGPASAAALSASRCSRAEAADGGVEECDPSRSSTSNATSSATTTTNTATVQRVAREVKVIKGPPTQRRRYSPAIARRCSASGPCTSAAAISGSVGPVPNDGQSLASTHTPQAGLRAWHTRRP